MSGWQRHFGKWTKSQMQAICLLSDSIYITTLQNKSYRPENRLMLSGIRGKEANWRSVGKGTNLYLDNDGSYWLQIFFKSCKTPSKRYPLLCVIYALICRKKTKEWEDRAVWGWRSLLLSVVHLRYQLWLQKELSSIFQMITSKHINVGLYKWLTKHLWRLKKNQGAEKCL